MSGDELPYVHGHGHGHVSIGALSCGGNANSHFDKQKINLVLFKNCTCMCFSAFSGL